MVRVLISLLPVFVFLGALIYSDSFKLIKAPLIIQTISAGFAAAIISYFINSYLLENLAIEHSTYTMYVSPLIEESLKASFIIYLLGKKKIGFMVDAAIYGFAIGTGFALIENIYYLSAVDQSNLIIWFIRGFGTAVMHGGTTAIFAIITKNIMDRKKEFKLKHVLPGLLTVIFYHLLPGLIFAIGIHSFFNHFILAPVILTILQLIVLPAVILYVFYRSEVILKNWLESGMDTDVELLQQINEGRLSESHIGQYLNTLQNNFSSEVIVDMIAYIRNHIELSIQAKGVLLLKQAGIPVTVDEETRDKFRELKYLEKSIGQTGKLAISPILHTSTRDLWQLYMLEKS
ncbi:MAG TPA: PrsW family glutamic-type intramembrane protease [Ignavibacteriaceae bacterium]